MTKHIVQTISLLPILVSMAATTSPLSAQVIANPWHTPGEARAALLRLQQTALMPADAADLDRWWASQDVAKLIPRLRSASSLSDIALDLNWERARIADGAGFLMVYTYMTDLWRAGAVTPASNGGDGLKQSAGMMLAYAYTLVVLDGTRCADPSAPIHRRDQLITQNQDLARFVGTQSRTTRITMGSVALGYEAATAALRDNDEVLCSDGLDQMRAGIAAQKDEPLAEAPSAKGVIGRTYLVPRPPGYTTAFVDEAIWRPKQSALRLTMPATLTRLLDVPGDQPASAGAAPHP